MGVDPHPPSWQIEAAVVNSYLVSQAVPSTRQTEQPGGEELVNENKWKVKTKIIKTELFYYFKGWDYFYPRWNHGSL